MKRIRRIGGIIEIEIMLIVITTYERIQMYTHKHIICNFHRDAEFSLFHDDWLSTVFQRGKPRKENAAEKKKQKKKKR